MGMLGTYLRDARIERGIDLRDAAQQTRISLQYLKSLEEEDFSKLPGEIFVKGFLKSYARFLDLDEAEVMKRYEGMRPKPAAAGAGAHYERPAAETAVARSSKAPLEPFLWGGAIFILLLVFLFTALPTGHRSDDGQNVLSQQTGSEALATIPAVTSRPEKLYLEVIALEDTWLLVRTDSSPQKKAVLKKGESLIWSADQRFLLSYGSAGAVKLLLNGVNLQVNEPRNAVVRDMLITASGIENRNMQEYARPPRQAQPRTVTQPRKTVPSPKPHIENQATRLTTTHEPVSTHPTSTHQTTRRHATTNATATHQTATAEAPAATSAPPLSKPTTTPPAASSAPPSSPEP